jgi:predicted HTH domain antitoxin
MGAIIIKIPEDVVLSAKIPRKRIREELKKEFAIHLYKEGILSFGAARRLADMEKMDFHFLLGQRKTPRHYDLEDYQKDLSHIAKWMKK